MCFDDKQRQYSQFYPIDDSTNNKLIEVGDRHGQNPVLPAGQHAFNFNFVLPPHLKMPSSVELGHCNIRYMIEAVIDKPWKFDHKAKRAFTLLESIDCNDPSLSVSNLKMQ